MEERRKHQRYKAVEGIAATIRAEDSDLNTEGILLNISKAGAYVFANSIPFQTGQVVFQLDDTNCIRRRCRRIDPHQSKSRGQAIAFTQVLSDDELEALKAPVVE
jgi:hypothetical protein